MLKPLLCTCALALLLLTGCKEEVLTPVDFSADYEYFPLELNQPKFFALDSIVVLNTSRGVVYDTTRLEVRETLVETFTAADGTELWRGERWDRRLPDGDWRFRQTYTLDRDETNASRSEDNLRFLKMVFPIASGKQWDGHRAFDDDREFVIGGEFVDVYFGWRYSYVDPAATAITNSPALQRFSDAVIIRQDSTDNLLARSNAYEIYAPGIGRVERFIDARRTQCRVCCNNGADTATCFDLPWEAKAEKGFILLETFLR